MSEEATLDEFTGQPDNESESTEELRKDGFLTLPYDWSISTLAEVAKEGGLVDGDWIESDDMNENGEIQLVQLGHIGQGQFKGEPDRLITKEFAEKEDCTVLSEGDLLISRMQEPILRSCLLPPFDRDSVMAVDIARLREKEDWNRQFLKYVLNSRPIWKQGIAWASGTTRKRISRKNMEKLRIPTPSLSEQRKIATVLYTVDRAIEKTESIVDQINTVKEGVKDELLTDGLRDAETTETRLGPVSTKIPAHWDTGRIGDLFTDRQLGTDERGTTEDGENIDLIKMGNLNFGTWDLSEVEKIKKNPQLLKEVGLHRGDLLFNTRNTPDLVGKTAVWEFDHEAIYDNNLLRLRFGGEISSSHFVNAYLSSNIGRRQLRGRVHGTTSVAAIYWTDLQQVEIPVPPKEEQREIVDTLHELDKIRKHNKSYRDHLQRLKHGLMQDLLSGKVRTTDTNIQVPDEIV